MLHNQQDEAGWTALLLHHRLLLWAPVRADASRPAPSKQELVLERLRRFWQQECASLLADLDTAEAAYAEHRRLQGDRDTQDTAALLSEVVRKARLGEFSRAAGLLTSLGVAPLTPATAEELSKLLLHGPLSEEDEESPAVEPQPLQVHVFTKALRKASRGSGPGCSGSRFEHCQILLESEDATRALCDVASLLALGQVPTTAAACSALARLVPLRKGEN